jgi:hypothetical protein
MNDCYRCRYLEPFNKMVPIYHPFERGVAEKVILAFAQDPEAQKAATEAGASKASLIFLQFLHPRSFNADPHPGLCLTHAERFTLNADPVTGQ